MISTFISSFKISDIFYLITTLLILYVSRYYYNYFTRPNPLPGPFPLPIFGNIHQKFGYGFVDWLMLLHKKLILTEGFKEYGIGGTGIVNNVDPKSWKYNRQFFIQAMMIPSFNNQSINWTNELWLEMESYWNGENHELDLLKWMHRFTNEMIFRISTGVKSNGVYAYYHTLIPKNNKLSEEEKERNKESEDLIQSLEMLLRGFVYFFVLNSFMRHYISFIHGKIKSLLKNRDYYFDKLYDIIKKRRIEIDNTPSPT
ncbi:hypothetical protein RclHR1_05720013 [Rhizophagus clarus]|uniref:Cytochrome P450 n=1 Tax=Rhizophagus clarus TaxID=94130 RepID=A0A2Z6S5V3_9GLOM|nr:hypothetical protein RclHR1_05720013 [Rhizophagus clarus]